MTAAGGSGVRRGRPKDQAKREAILDAAWKLFTTRGVAEVGLEAVAAEAGVSRMTVYGHFGGRPALLAAVVGREAARVLPLLAPPAGAGRTPGDRLLAFGRAYLELVTRPEVMALDRLVIAAGAGQPELLAAYLAAGPDRVLAEVAGTLREVDPDMVDAPAAARRFVALLIGDLLLDERYGRLVPPSPEERETRVQEAVRIGCGAWLGSVRPRASTAGRL